MDKGYKVENKAGDGMYPYLIVIPGNKYGAQVRGRVCAINKAAAEAKVRNLYRNALARLKGQGALKPAVRRRMSNKTKAA